MENSQKWQCDACLQWYGFLYGPLRHNAQCKSGNQAVKVLAKLIERLEWEMLVEFQVLLDTYYIGPVNANCQEMVTVLNGRENGMIMVDIEDDSTIKDLPSQVEKSSPGVYIKQSNTPCELTADQTRVNCPLKCGQTFTTKAIARRHGKSCSGQPRADIQRPARRPDSIPARPLIVNKRPRVYTLVKCLRRVTGNPLLLGVSFATWKRGIGQEEEVSLVANRLKVEEVSEFDLRDYGDYCVNDEVENEITEYSDIEDDILAESYEKLTAKSAQDKGNNIKSLAESQNLNVVRHIFRCLGCRWSETRKAQYVIPCPAKAALDESNSLVLEYTEGDRRYFVWSVSCQDCMRMQQKINRWICQSRMDPNSGDQLCSANKTCSNKAEGKMRQRTTFTNVKTWKEERKKSNSDEVECLLPGSEISDATTMANFLSANVEKFHMLTIWTDVKKAVDLGNQGSQAGVLAYFVDTEYYSRGTYPRLLEVALVNCNGECIFEATIDHEMTLGDLMAEVPSQGMIHHIARGSIKKVYGKDPTAMENIRCLTFGIKITELADKLVGLGVSAETIFLEWSTAWSDFHCLSSNLGAIGRDGYLPEKDRWLRVPVAWRQQVMPGIATCALELLFPLVFPEHASWDHHRARVDSLKLFWMTKRMLEFVE